MTPDEARQRAVEAAFWAYLGHSPKPTRVERERVAVACAAYERALWQPAETAPKGDKREGPRLLVETKSGWIGIAYWQREPVKWEGHDDPCWAVFEPEDHYYSFYLDDDDPPIRWCPLPDGPGDAP